MKEQIIQGNIFKVAKDYIKQTNDVRTAVVITTNGMTKRNGAAVMGAGIAKYAAFNLTCANPELLEQLTDSAYKKSATIDYVLGKKLAQNGNNAYYLGEWHDYVTDTTVHIMTMPTKYDWRNDSDLELIKKSCKQLNTLATANGINQIFLPAPGCSCGHLSFADVGPAINAILDDRFTCAHPKM